jgi:hypothetical protein
MIFLLCQVLSCQRYVNKHNGHQSKGKQLIRVVATAAAVIAASLIIVLIVVAAPIITNK